MNKRTMTMQVVETTQKPGDIIYINDDRWIVTHLVSNFKYVTIYLEPLTDYIAKTNRITVCEREMPIAEYIKILCDEYEYNCAC